MKSKQPEKEVKFLTPEEFYSNPEFYDMVNHDVVEDIPFYESYAKEIEGEVLEIGCGTGRVTIPLAKEGVKITGLDIVPELLAHAKKKASQSCISVDWIEADMVEMELGKKYDLIVVPYNTLTYILDSKKIIDSLRVMINHLSDKGRLIIDIFNPTMSFLNADPEKIYTIAQYEKPYLYNLMEITQSAEYDPATQQARITIYHQFENESDIIAYQSIRRVFFPEEMEEILYAVGGKVDARYGYYDKREYDAYSPLQILECSINPK